MTFVADESQLVPLSNKYRDIVFTEHLYFERCMKRLSSITDFKKILWPYHEINISLMFRELFGHSLGIIH